MAFLGAKLGNGAVSKFQETFVGISNSFLFSEIGENHESGILMRDKAGRGEERNSFD